MNLWTDSILQRYHCLTCSDGLSGWGLCIYLSLFVRLGHCFVQELLHLNIVGIQMLQLKTSASKFKLYFNLLALTFLTFISWALLVHFIYFQLPLRSKAIAFAHPMSFIGNNKHSYLLWDIFNSRISPCSIVHILKWKL